MTVIISLLILLTYIIWVTIKHGIPASLSQTYYLVKPRLLFMFVIWVSNFLILVPAMDMAGDLKFIAFLGIFGALLVGAAPRIREGERTVHMIGAITCGVFSQLFVALYGTYLSLCSWIIAPILLLASNKGRLKGLFREGLEDRLDSVQFVFWCEMICYFTLYTSLILGGV